MNDFRREHAHTQEKTTTTINEVSLSLVYISTSRPWIYHSPDFDLQSSISRSLDHECGATPIEGPELSSNKLPMAVATRLNVIDPHSAKRQWDKRRHNVDFYDARLSWIQIPDKLREHVQFSWTTLDGEGDKNTAFVPGMDDQRELHFYDTEESGRGINWLVKFPRPFASDNVTVRPWYMDMNVYHRGDGNPHGLKLEIGEISRDHFRMSISVPRRSACDYVRIGYVAYEGGSTPEGFHAEQYHLDVPMREQNQPQNHEHKPFYFPFPQGKFHRRPAVAPMMSMFWIRSAWNYRADVRFAASHDGFVIQGRSWADTILMDLKFEILAIANE